VSGFSPKCYKTLHRRAEIERGEGGREAREGRRREPLPPKSGLIT